MRTFLALAAAAVAGLAPAAEPLGIGDKAPPLTLKSFVKGEPVTGFDKGKVYVVEFWATWCGPCIAGMPHLSDLQKKFPQATVIGVNVWERGEKIDEKVKKFVEKMGDKMSYRVALDDVPEEGKGKMATGWMEAAEQDGIPAAFVVNGDGVIAWVGHPGEMDEPLEQIVAGKWDVKKAKEEVKKANERKAKLQALGAKLRKAQKDPKETLKIIDAALADDAGLEPMLADLKLQALVKTNDIEAALAYGDKLIAEVFKTQGMPLNNIAWPLVENPGDKPDPRLMKLAVRMAEKADKLTGGKESAVADTLGTAYFHAGELAKAVEAQERAVKLAKGTPDEAEMKERLETFKKKLAEKK